LFPLRDNIPTHGFPYVTFVLLAAALAEKLAWSHGGWVLLAGNVLVLWIFGQTLERAMGPVRFVVFAALGAVAGGAVELPAATGAAAALVGGYLLVYPGARVIVWSLIPLFVGMIEVPVLIIAGLWVVLVIVAGAGLSALAGGAVGLALVRVFAREVAETPPRGLAF